MELHKFLLFLTLCFSCAQGAKILSIICTMSKSHHIVITGLLKGLAEKGHQITVYTPFMDKDLPKNYEQIYVEGIEEIANGIQSSINPNQGMVRTLMKTMPVFYEVGVKFWESKAIQNLIKTKPKYDLVITMPLIVDSINAFAWYCDAPLILFFPGSSSFLTNKYVGNPNPPYASSVVGNFPPESFVSRLVMYTFIMATSLADNYLGKPKQDALLQKYLPGAPCVDDIMQNISLVFVNSHFSIEPPRPYVPNLITLGGIHSKEPKPLSNDLKDFLDTAKHGVVLLTFGSNVRVANVEQDKLDAILQGLAKIAPIKVLFKSEIPLPNAAKNIKVMEWVPQNDILGHPNVKAFISHGGLGGTTESVFHGVPMLGIPFFADQNVNVMDANKAGYLVPLKYQDITQASFDKALHEVLHNENYKKNAMLRSDLIRNQPQKPIDKATYWVEHIIKYKGGKHLRNNGMDLTWYETYLVDIILFYTFVIIVLNYMLYLFIKFAINFIRKSLSKSKKVKKN